jgi:hypothetical protein
MLKHSLPRLGALLALLIVAVLAMPAKPAHALTITVDGNGSDWPGGTLIGTDPNEGTIPDNVDFNTTYWTNDSVYLYIRFDTHAATRWEAVDGAASPPFVQICLNTDNSNLTGAVVINCGSQPGVDRLLRITGYEFGDTPTYTLQLRQCTPTCSIIPATNAQFATSGTVNELRLQLSTLGITGPSPACPGGAPVPVALYFDNQTTDPDDNNPDSGTLTGNIPCPTPVTLTSLSAMRGDAGVELAWSTSSELNIAGYHILRSAAGREAAVRITTALIGGEGSGVSGANYRFTDTSAAVGTSYSYWLEVVNSDGSPEEYGPVRYDPAGTARSFVYLPLVR